jgi:hypothetical protein
MTSATVYSRSKITPATRARMGRTTRREELQAALEQSRQAKSPRGDYPEPEPAPFKRLT